jgi:hypothetical protein
MELETLKLLLAQVDGSTFATIDSTTSPTPGVRKVTTGTRVILFTKENGYEEMVRRRLTEAGKDPRDFVLSDLPWGERIPNSPFIVCRGRHYLQTVVLEPGKSTCYLGDAEVDCKDFVSSRRTNQGLSKDNEVHVATYRLDHIDRISLMGEVLVASTPGLTRLGA